MKRSNLVILAILVIAAIAAAIIFAGRTTDKPTSLTSPTGTPKPLSGPEQAASSAVTVTYSSTGFSPSTSTLKSGGVITFKNDSSSAIQVDSDPHPVHTDNTELNIGSIAPGASKSATLNKTGDWGFHNHLDPSNTARVTVQ